MVKDIDNEVKEDIVIDFEQSRAELLSDNIRSKIMIENFMYNTLDREEMAYLLASDEELRKTTEKVVDGIINPDPLKAIVGERAPVGIDVGHGLSTFWNELKTPIDAKVSAAAGVKDVLDDLSIATNAKESPEMRDEIYAGLGMDVDQINELVPEEDRVNYIEALKGHYRNDHMVRLNLKDGDMLDIEDEILLDELVEDSMATSYNGLDQIPPDFIYEDAFVDEYLEEYGLTAEEIIGAFSKHDMLEDLSDQEILEEAIKNMEEIYTNSIEDNEKDLAWINNTQKEATHPVLNEEDLEDLEENLIELTEDDLAGLEPDDIELSL